MFLIECLKFTKESVAISKRMIEIIPVLNVINTPLLTPITFI